MFKSMLLLWVFQCIVLVPLFVTSLNPSVDDDLLALIAFKADIQDTKDYLSTWSEDNSNVSDWRGVTYSLKLDRVKELVLEGLSLSGRISRALLKLDYLRKLSLSNNHFTGSLPASLTQLGNLVYLDLSHNSLSGSIPEDYFQQCGPLKSISLSGNQFTGKIPSSLRTCSSLLYVNFSSNKFSGSLDSDLWSLQGVRSLDFSSNFIQGGFPGGIGGLSNLRYLSFQKNMLSGELPEGIGNCLLLKSLDASDNSLSGELPNTMEKLSSCSYLNLQGNSLEGSIPYWIGEMKGLEFLDLSRNNISGQVPTTLGDLQSLKTINISRNAITGGLPDSMRNCSGLSILDVRKNSLSGVIPAWVFGVLKKLLILDLSNNNLSGDISSSVGYARTLQVLNLSANFLVGSIPNSIESLRTMTILDLGMNHLNGSVPVEIGGLVSLKELWLENNLLSGSIPASIQNCTLLKSLVLSRNSFTGRVSEGIAKLTNLQYVDFSFNDLEGSLPKLLADLPHLRYFNISHNRLEGSLPVGRFFNTMPYSSILGNPLICGAVANKSCHSSAPKPLVLNPDSSSSLPSSSSDPLPPSRRSHHKVILSVSTIVAIGAATVILIGIIAITVLNLRVRSLESPSAAAFPLYSGDECSRSPSSEAHSGKLVMFSGSHEFNTGSHALLNKDCEIGRSGFGAVYRAALQDGRTVAIKKLVVSSLVKSQEEFEKEVKKLGKIQHANIVELEGYYWTSSLQLVIYEFVPGGSLQKHLHGQNTRSLSWNERFNIVLGTARGLAHLHQQGTIHCNLKSSNVLIDSSGVPKVGDYGLVKLLPVLDRYVLSSKVQSALGYMAPEFGCKTVKITEKCDVYGFGVLVLEVVCGKRPVEYKEDDVVVLCDMVRGVLEEGRVVECLDQRLDGEFVGEEAMTVIKLGLMCTSQVPSARPDMAEVVNVLELIRCPSPPDLHEKVEWA